MFRFITQFLGLVILVRNSYSTDRIEVDLCDNCNYTSYKLINLTFNDDLVKLQAPRECAFFVIQVHHQHGESVLSYEPSANRTKSVRGNNLGLVQINNGSSHTFYSLNQFNDTKVLFALVSYTAKAPIPGGCNMEFNTTIAPYLKVTYDDNVRYVEFQKSSVVNATCDTQNTAMELYYANAIYYDFSETSYFALILNLLTVENITKTGLSTLHPYQGSELRRLFSNYIGLGVAYNAIAYGGQGSSAYVPCVSYGRIPHTNDFDTNYNDFLFFSILFFIYSAHPLQDETAKAAILLQLYFMVFCITTAIITYWNLPNPFYFRHGIAFLTLPLMLLCEHLWRRPLINVNLTLTLIALLYSFGLPQIAMFYNYSLWLFLSVAIASCYLLTHHLHPRVASWMMALFPLLIHLGVELGPSQYIFYAYIDIIRAATVKDFWMASRSIPFSWMAPLFVGIYVCAAYMVHIFVKWCMTRICRRWNYVNIDDSSSDDESSD